MDPVAEGHIQLSSEHLQKWRSHKLSTYPIVKPDHPDCENLIPKIRTYNFKTILIKLIKKIIFNCFSIFSVQMQSYS